MKDIDEEKVEIVTMFYLDNWDKMAAYDTDEENVEWHITNCMNYIIQRSEDINPVYMPPPGCYLSDSWSERELLMLYRDLMGDAERRGYVPDPGMLTRIRNSLSPRRIYVRRAHRP